MGRKGQRQVIVWLSDAQAAQMRQVLYARGETYSSWVRAMLSQCVAERAPESQGDVKKIIPAEIARMAMATLDQYGDFLLQLARRPDEPHQQVRLRRIAGAYMDAAGWFSSVLSEQRHRQHLLDSGQRVPRHRLKSSAKPADDNSLKTIASPKE